MIEGLNIEQLLARKAEIDLQKKDLNRQIDRIPDGDKRLKPLLRQMKELGDEWWAACFALADLGYDKPYAYDK